MSNKLDYIAIDFETANYYKKGACSTIKSHKLTDCGTNSKIEYLSHDALEDS